MSIAGASGGDVQHDDQRLPGGCALARGAMELCDSVVHRQAVNFFELLRDDHRPTVGR